MNPITREESLLDGQDLTPITRKEQFIKRIYDKTQEVPTPVTREEWFLNKAAEGSGGDVTIEQLSVTENGTYSEQGKAYSPVIVEVPAPTLKTKTITENGTYNASADNADGYSQVTVNVEGFKKKSIANTPTAIASFNDGTANPMPSLEISIEPVQSGSGDPSPENVRPISGWSGAKIADDAEYGGFINWNQLIYNGNFVNTQNWRTYAADFNASENVCTFTARSQYGAVVQTININSNHIFLATCGVKLTTATTNVQFGVGESYIEKGENATSTTDWQTLSLLFTGVGGTIRVADYRASGWDAINVKNVMCIDLTQMFGKTKANEIYAMEQATAGSGVAYVRSLLPNDYYTRNAGEITTVSAVNGDADKYSITSIHFHDNSDNPITVYGGTLNVTSGELRVDRVSKTYVGASNENWIAILQGFYIEELTMQSGTYRNGLSNWLKTAHNNDDENSMSITFGTQYQVIKTNHIKDNISDITDVASWKTYLASNNLTVNYPLATPQTYQLTPAQVSTLLGQNNIFADCGQVLEGEYFVTL